MSRGLIGRYLWQNPGIRQEATRLLAIAKDSHQVPNCTCGDVEETVDGALHEPGCPMIPFARALWMEATERWMEHERENTEQIPKDDWQPEADDANL